ncbi:MAG TPA: PAS domain-containing protein [Phenylobacterium sp.]|nr:PAS domain-containing protein [Phenylobacterium sp.]
MTRLAISDEMLTSAAAAVALKDHDPRAVLEAQESPIYLTDDEGIVVYANDACERFAGRPPALGEDRWCVTWKLYTDAGEFLPHEQCPMAMAIRERKPIRGASAVAERPDGTRVPFRPFPTPIFGRGGRLVGAVNVLMPS